MASIYEQIGGEAAVHATVEAFYVRILSDPLLIPFFSRTLMSHQKKQQVNFITTALGGPQIYKGRAMCPAHRKLAIEQRHFDRVVHHLVETLRSLNVPEHLIAQIGAKLAPLASEIVNTPTRVERPWIARASFMVPVLLMAVMTGLVQLPQLQWLTGATMMATTTTTTTMMSTWFPLISLSLCVTSLVTDVVSHGKLSAFVMMLSAVVACAQNVMSALAHAVGSAQFIGFCAAAVVFAGSAVSAFGRWRYKEPSPFRTLPPKAPSA